MYIERPKIARSPENEQGGNVDKTPLTPKSKEEIHRTDFLNILDHAELYGGHVEIWNHRDAGFQMDMADYVSDDLRKEARETLRYGTGRGLVPFPAVSRTLRTDYNKRVLSVPSGAVAEDLPLSNVSWISRHYRIAGDDYTYLTTLSSSTLRSFHKEGVLELDVNGMEWDQVLQHEREKYPKKEPVTYKEYCELPTRKLDRPFYLAGPAQSIWLGGGNNLAYATPPVSVDVSFSRMNPKFSEYMQGVLERIEACSLEDIVDAHIKVNADHDFGLTEEGIRKGCESYFNNHLPRVKKAIETLLTGDTEVQAIGEDRLVAYEDGVNVFLTTKLPVVPMLFFPRPKDKDGTAKFNNERYEQVMMEEYGDPKLSSYSWADLATMFQIRVGGANTPHYLTIPQDEFERNAEAHVRSKIESTKAQTKAQREREKAKAEEKARIEEERRQKIEKYFANVEFFLPEDARFLPQMLLESASDGEEIFPGPASIFADNVGRQARIAEGIETNSDLRQSLASGIPTLFLSWEDWDSIARRDPELNELSKDKNFLYLRLPVTPKKIREEIIRLREAGDLKEPTLSAQEAFKIDEDRLHEFWDADTQEQFKQLQAADISSLDKSSLMTGEEHILLASSWPFKFNYPLTPGIALAQPGKIREINEARQKYAEVRCFWAPLRPALPAPSREKMILPIIGLSNIDPVSGETPVPKLVGLEIREGGSKRIERDEEILKQYTFDPELIREKETEWFDRFIQSYTESGDLETVARFEKSKAAFLKYYRNTKN